MLEHETTGIVREFTWWGTREDGTTFLNFSETEKFLVLSGVRTPATCLADECFIHYTMPLGQGLKLMKLEPVAGALNLPGFGNCDEEVHQLVHVEVAVVVAVGQTENSARHVATRHDL